MTDGDESLKKRTKYFEKAIKAKSSKCRNVESMLVSKLISMNDKQLFENAVKLTDELVSSFPDSSLAPQLTWSHDDEFDGMIDGSLIGT